MEASWQDVPAAVYPVIMNALLNGRDRFSFLTSSKDVYSCREDMQDSLHEVFLYEGMQDPVAAMLFTPPPPSAPTHRCVVHVSIYNEVHVCVCVCAYVCVHACVRVHVSACMSAFVCM